MKLAIINGERRVPEKGIIGSCIGCGQPMIAKCGSIKMWHWAHKVNCVCDHWWENETEWHRSWKNQFPTEWQEIRHKADNGEWHISDVKTQAGHFLEFQHSFLRPEERKSRNGFYGSNLVWIVDGLARKNDRLLFEEILKSTKRIHQRVNVFQLQRVDMECPLIRDWSECSGLVFFDFGIEAPLWCLLPISPMGHRYLLPYQRQNFVDTHKCTVSGRGYFELVEYLNNLISMYENPIQKKAAAVVNSPPFQRRSIGLSAAESRALYNFMSRSRYSNRRRFRF